MNNNLKKPLWQEISPKVKKIAILSWGKLGDILTTTPVVEKIKECFPNASITIIADAMANDIYQKNPKVSQIIIWRDQIGLSEKIRLIQKIRKQKFDLIVDQYHGDRSKLISYFSNARYRVGFEGQDILSRLAYNCCVKRIIKNILYHDQRVVLLALEIDISSMKNLAIFYFDSTHQKKLLSDFKLNKKDFWIINLGVAIKNKQYPVSSFVNIAQHLIKNNQKIAVIYNPDKPELQKQFKDEYLKQSNHDMSKIISLSKLSINNLATVISASKAVITGDTGIVHLSCATFIQTIAIFVGIKQTVFIDGNHFHPLVEKNNKIPSSNEVIQKIDFILSK